MEDEKITLDMKAFKTLASDSRISILKSLDERRKTLTELSKTFGLSASTVKEHMEKLAEAGLVKMIDDGHKWKYYELTLKGRQILHPGTSKIWVMLVISTLGLFYSFWDINRISFSKPLLSVANRATGAGNTLAAAPEAIKVTEGMASDASTQAVPVLEPVVHSLPIYHLIGIAAFALIMGLAVATIYYKNKQLKL